MQLCSHFEFGNALSCNPEPKISRKPLLRNSPIGKVIGTDGFLQMAVAQWCSYLDPGTQAWSCKSQKCPFIHPPFRTCVI